MLNTIVLITRQEIFCFNILHLNRFKLNQNPFSVSITAVEIMIIDTSGSHTQKNPINFNIDYKFSKYNIRIFHTYTSNSERIYSSK